MTAFAVNWADDTYLSPSQIKITKMWKNIHL